MRRNTVMALGAVNLLLAGVAIGFASISELPLPRASGKSDLDLMEVSAMANHARVVDIAAALERPLFLRGRRPAPSDVPAPKTESAGAASTAEAERDKNRKELRSNYVLTGVVILQDQAFAVIESVGDEKPAAVARGEALGDWRLDEIHADRAVFSRDALSETLLFPKTGSTKAASATPRQGQQRARTYRSP